jgi:hypothetical protein
MKIAEIGTVIGYHVESGKQLFIHPNRVIRNYEGLSTLPTEGQMYEGYEVAGVREGSTGARWEIDVRS